MTSNMLLNWALLVVSLFNTILLIWLGLMVLLNTEQRGRGLYLTGGGLLLGGLFFLSHTAILGYSTIMLIPSLDIWWQIGWIPLTCLPFAWYAIMLWYSGYWNASPADGAYPEPQANLRRRHKPWLWGMFIMALSFLLLLTFAHPLPSAAQLLAYDLNVAPALFGVPALLMLYPIYTVLCTGLSMDVLWLPGPSTRLQAGLARQRARPWLGAASLALFAVSLLVGGTVFWVVSLTRQPLNDGSMAIAVGGLDLVISGLIGLAVLLVGQAVVSYEVFTGKTLPRRGLQRYWQSAILLAGGYSAAVSLAMLLDFRPITILLAATLVLAVFYALLSWRSFGERQRYMENLRPFLVSQGLYEELVREPAGAPGSSPGGETDQASPVYNAFRALCHSVLEARLAYLVPLGPLTALAGPPLVYPAATVGSPPTSAQLLEAGLEGVADWLPLDPHTHSGAAWAIPLRSQAGLVGALLLGPRLGNGIYSQEDVELARLAGERLIDAQASAEIARRLMALQRQRLAESQLMDRQARRVLHDDILPQLHASILQLSSQPSSQEQAEAVSGLVELHGKIAALLRELPISTTPEIEQLGLAEALEKLVEVEHRASFDEAEWEATPEALQGMASLPTLNSEVVYYAVREAVRNAARYGRGGRLRQPLHLRVRASWENGLQISVTDDGVGLAGPHEHTNGGAGQGLALHSTLLAVLRGTLEIHSLPEGSTTVNIFLPGKR
jgi:signal transduction histidine kinase